MTRNIGSTFLVSKCPKCNINIKIRTEVLGMRISYCENCEWELKHE